MTAIPGVILIEPSPSGRAVCVSARPAWRLGIAQRQFQSMADARSYGLDLAERAGLLLVDLTGSEAG